jgi:CRP-like cAMP-binding protein
MQAGFVCTKLADLLASTAALSDDELEFLTKMPYNIRHFSSGDELLRKGDRPAHCCLLLQGYLCWKDPEFGQITSVYVPGDIPGLDTIIVPRVYSHLTALRQVVVAFVPHAFFEEITSVSLNLDRSLQLLMLREASRLQNGIINLGTRDSLARVAHLLCEIIVRLQAVGLAKDNAFGSPFTQSDLASACAITPVHANRVVQQLRRKGLLTWQSRKIVISDLQALSRLAGFESGYLGVRKRPCTCRSWSTNFHGGGQNVRTFRLSRAGPVFRWHALTSAISLCCAVSRRRSLKRGTQLARQSRPPRPSMHQSILRDVDGSAREVAERG